MKAGRNDPCPCGSGRKYKKCCLAQDKTNRQEQLEVRSRELVAPRVDGEPAPFPAPFIPTPRAQTRRQAPPNPRIKAINARWEEFKEQDVDGQIELFLATVEDADLMDDELAFSMLETLYRESIRRNERDRFDDLVEILRARLPAVYAKSKKCYLRWQFSNATACQRLDAARLVAKAMAEMEDGDIDLFNEALNQLAYHGQLGALVEVMRIAWPRVENMWSVVPWGVDRFAARLSEYVVFEHLERNPSLNVDEPGLTEEIKGYVDLRLDKFEEHLDWLTGRTQRAWTMRDFRFQIDSGSERWDSDGEPKVIANAATANLGHLMDQFVVYLHRERGSSYPKAELAREQIHQYILDRLAGQLCKRRSMFEDLMSRRRSRGHAPPPPPKHALCPDRATLDTFLARRLDFMAPQYHRVAATLELVPAWLRFLEQCTLIESSLRAKTLDELKKIHGDLGKLWGELDEYPALRESFATWPD